MKKLILSLIVALCAVTTYAANPDSVAYQLQRAKINNLLAQRAEKFNQYSTSLSTKTGIFGWQTKKDIRRSGEILMDIAKTDEVIFKQIKILLDFKTFQTTQVVAQSHDNEDRSFNYMKTINKLRDQNDKLLHDQAELNNEYNHQKTFHIIIILLLILTSFFLFFRKLSVNKA